MESGNRCAHASRRSLLSVFTALFAVAVLVKMSPASACQCTMGLGALTRTQAETENEITKSADLVFVGRLTQIRQVPGNSPKRKPLWDRFSNEGLSGLVAGLTDAYLDSHDDTEYLFETLKTIKGQPLSRQIVTDASRHSSDCDNAEPNFSWAIGKTVRVTAYFRQGSNVAPSAQRQYLADLSICGSSFKLLPDRSVAIQR